MLKSTFVKALSTTALGAALLVGAISTQAAASDLKTLVEKSNLIARTRVAAVAYRTGGPGNLPYTIVTFAVQSSARGEAGKWLSLRFLGGPDGRGHITEVSTSPVFQVGDEDILFINNNGQTSGCPLVDCMEGRFRVLKEAVYDGHGSPVYKLDGDNVLSGGEPPKLFLTQTFPAPKFDNLLANKEFAAMLAEKGMSVDEARKEYEANATPIVLQTVLGDEEVDRGSTNPKLLLPAMPSKDFLNAVMERVVKAPAGDGSVRNFDPKIADNRVIEPIIPADAEKVTIPPVLSDAEKAEQLRLPKERFSRKAKQ